MSSSANGMSGAAEGQAPSPSTEEQVFSLSAAEGRALFDAVKTNKALLTLPHPLLKKMLSQYAKSAPVTIAAEVVHHLQDDTSGLNGRYSDGTSLNFANIRDDVSFLINLPDGGALHAANVVLDHCDEMQEHLDNYYENEARHCETMDSLVLDAVEVLMPLSHEEAAQLHMRLVAERNLHAGFHAQCDLRWARSYRFARDLVLSQRRKVVQMLVFRATEDRLPSELSELIIDRYMLRVARTLENSRLPASKPYTFLYGSRYYLL